MRVLVRSKGKSLGQLMSYVLAQIAGTAGLSFEKI